MTHRDDQIAAAAAALDDEFLNRGTWLDGVLPLAHAVVDAVLPQIHTRFPQGPGVGSPRRPFRSLSLAGCLVGRPESPPERRRSPNLGKGTRMGFSGSDRLLWLPRAIRR